MGKHPREGGKETKGEGGRELRKRIRANMERRPKALERQEDIVDLVEDPSPRHSRARPGHKQDTHEQADAAPAPSRSLRSSLQRPRPEMPMGGDAQNFSARQSQQRQGGRSAETNTTLPPRNLRGRSAARSSHKERNTSDEALAQRMRDEEEAALQRRMEALEAEEAAAEAAAAAARRSGAPRGGTTTTFLNPPRRGGRPSAPMRPSLAGPSRVPPPTAWLESYTPSDAAARAGRRRGGQTPQEEALQQQQQQQIRIQQLQQQLQRQQQLTGPRSAGRSARWLSAAARRGEDDDDDGPPGLVDDGGEEENDDDDDDWHVDDDDEDDDDDDDDHHHHHPFAGSVADMLFGNMGLFAARRWGNGGPPRHLGSGGHGGHGFPFGDIAALHQAVTAARSNALPPHLLFSDRDFTDEDYEALLALDEGVENRKGAVQREINAIPTERVPRRAGAAAEMGDCPICLEKFAAGEVLRRLSCKHKFHKNCLDTWLKTKADCPVCRIAVRDDDEHRH